MNEELVSIITPCYNAEKFILETYESIKNQTYQNWEWIIVDDQSTDDSCRLIKDIEDSRVRLYEPKEKLGPANARNYAVNNANGRFIAYIDADDLWLPKKLENQIKFMEDKDCAFSFTGYEFANEMGIPNGKKVKVPNKISYKEALKNTTISTITVIFDLSKITKKEIYMKNVKSEDTALWWSVLKKNINAYGYNEILSIYRRTHTSLSANKIEAIRRIWFLYRKVEKLGLVYSAYCFAFYSINAILRRI